MLRNLSVWHLLILLAVVVLVFGVRRIPEIGAGLGRGIKEFKRNLLGEGSAESDDDAAERSEQREPKRRLSD